MEERGALAWIGRLLVATLLVGGGMVALRPGTGETAAVRFRDPTVWLPTGDTGEVVQVNGATGEVIARVLVGEPGDDLRAVQRGTDAMVLNATRGELSRVSGSSFRQDAMVEVPSGEATLLDAGDLVHVVAPGRIVTADVRTLAIEADEPLERASDPVVDAVGEVWYLDAVDGSLHRVAADVVVTEATDLAGGAVALVAREGDVLVVDGPAAALERRAEDVAEPAGCLDGPIADPGPAVGGTAGGAEADVVVVADSATGSVHVVDGSGCRRTDLGTGPARIGRPLLHGGVVFVPVEDRAELVVVDLATGEVRSRYALPGAAAGERIDLLVKDGIVWFNEPDGPLAGILDDDRVVRVVDKLVGGVSGEGIGGVVVGDEGDVVGVAADADGAAGAGGGSGGDGAGGGSGDGQVDGDGDGDGDASDALLDELGRIVVPSAPTGTTGGAAPPVAPADVLVADFTFSSDVVGVGEVVTFTDRSQGGPTSWTWDFGDGTLATGPVVSHTWSAAGVYTVTLLTENAGAADQASVVIRVLPADELPPRADFSLTSAQTEVNAPITFTSTSSGSDLTLRWDFGDGTTADGQTAVKAWPAPGQYRVVLTASNSLGADTAEITVIVVDRVQAPVAGIAASTTSLQTGQTATFASTSTGNPTRLDWDFGDGTTSRGVEARHAWDTPGTYTVTLTASNRAGRDRETVQVTVVDAAQPPGARFSVSAATIETGTPVTFTSTSTGDPTSLAWDFGDGTTGSGPSVAKTYSRPGSYVVRLTATNAVGTSTATRTVTVVAVTPPPIPAFTAPASVRAGEVAQFTDTSTGGPASSWTWNFGDGTPPSTVQSPSHIFERPGTYTVTLTTTNVAGSAIATRSVVVLPAAPSAAFTFTPVAPQQGATVQFTDTSAGDRTSWAWDFGNGQTSDRQNPTTTYAATGSYTVTLTVRNAGGVSTTTRRVSVNPPPPVASFTAPITAFTGQDVTFTNTSTGAEPITSAWTFGDSGTSTERSPTRTFTPGIYAVTLTVTNAGGSSTMVRTLTVTNPPVPVAAFTLAPDPPVAGSPVAFTNTSTAVAPVTYLWDFGDGTTSTAAAPAPKTYATPGDYTVRLTVTNAGGTNTTARTDTVRLPAPSFTVTTGDNGRVATLSALVAGGTTTTVDWGDGPPGAVPLPPGGATHTYAAPGVYTVTVETTGFGQTVSATRTVRVFTVEPTWSPTGSTVAFTADVVGIDPATVTWAWTFGDGGTSTLRNPSRSYADPGTYTVTVTATGPNGSARGTLTVTIP